MEFSININTTLFGEILIQDFSNNNGQYTEECPYNQSVTLNCLMKHTLETSKLVDVQINLHDSEFDKSQFKVIEDGYYVIHHIVIPTTKWNYVNTKHTTTYLFDSGKIQKYENAKLVECEIEELIERNVKNTNINRCEVDVFYTGNIQNCYINRSKDLFKKYLNQCVPKEQDNDVFARDFIWMSLNIIDYLVGFKKYMEAQQIVESLISCNGFCPSKLNKSNHSGNCGCY